MDTPQASRNPAQRQPRPSGASFRIGRFFGIDVIIHWSFWILYAYVAYLAYRAGGGPTMFAEYALLITAVFVCVVLHEFGHALTARRFGIATRDVTILPLGGVARLRGMPEKPGQEILVAIAGPAVNVAIAAILFPLAVAIRGVPAPEDMAPLTGDFIAQLAAINIFLVVFNMIPAFPMDGGRVLRALLALRMGRVDATRAAAAVGQVLAVGFFIAGLYFNPFLALIGVFVFFGGRAEAQGVAMQAAFTGFDAGTAMMTEFDSLLAGEPLGHAADTLLAGSQHEFPVLDDDRHPIGVLTRDALLRGLEQLGPDAPVSNAMQPSSLNFERSTPLRRAVEQMSAAQVSAVPVVENGRVVGLLTLENAGELAALRQASSRARRA